MWFSPHAVGRMCIGMRAPATHRDAAKSDTRTRSRRSGTIHRIRQSSPLVIRLDSLFALDRVVACTGELQQAEAVTERVAQHCQSAPVERLRFVLESSAGRHRALDGRVDIRDFEV